MERESRMIAEVRAEGEQRGPCTVMSESQFQSRCLRVSSSLQRQLHVFIRFEPMTDSNVNPKQLLPQKCLATSSLKIVRIREALKPCGVHTLPSLVLVPDERVLVRHPETV